MTTESLVVSRGGVGESPLRPDGTLKVTGEFAFSSDLFADDMLWGATLRSPYPRRGTGTRRQTRRAAG